MNDDLMGARRARESRTLTELLIGDLHKRFPCRIRVCAAYTPKSDLLLRCNFCLCCFHKKAAIDGMARDSETSSIELEIRKKNNAERISRKI